MRFLAVETVVSYFLIYTKKTSASNAVLYRIEEVIYQHLGKTRQANGFITIDEKTGDVTLGRSPRDFSAGLFDCKIASSDSSEAEAHLAYVQLKVRNRRPILPFFGFNL